MEDNGNDLIAISIVINKYLVKMILVDNESVVKVLTWEAFKGMCLDESLLKSVGSIYGFANQPIQAKGLVIFPITLDHGDNTMTKIT